MKRITGKQVTTHVEQCLESLVEEFKALAINFVVEADVEAELFKLLRKGPVCRKTMKYHHRRRQISLVHSQWPRVKRNKSGRLQRAGSYDIVIWQRASVRNPDDYWGIEPLKRAEKIKLSVVIEIKHRRNSLKTPDKWSKQDIEKLVDVVKTGKAKSGYYLVLIDEDINNDKRKAKYQAIAKLLRQQTRKYESYIKVLCAARSGLEDYWVS